NGVKREWTMNLAGALDAAVAALTYQEAYDRLKAGLADLPKPDPLPVIAMGAAEGGGAPLQPDKLLLGNDEHAGYASRALLPLTTADVIADQWAASVDLHDLVKPIAIDELTVAENPRKYVDALKAQPHLTSEFKAQLAAIYGAS